MTPHRCLALLPSLFLTLACGAPPPSGSSDAGQDAGIADAGSDAGIAAVDGGPADGGAADAGDSWNDYAQGFVTSYCLECHATGGSADPAGSTLDFSVYSNVQTNFKMIRCGVAVSQDPSWGCSGVGVAVRQFPIASPYPTDVERTRFVAWINAGLPQ